MNNALVDFHVHCGRFYDAYYPPKTVVKALYENGITKAWISSTTSCIDWNNKKEKKQILDLIDEEMKELVETASKYKMEIVPLYWVIPKRHIEGETISDVMNNSLYKGFKVHPKFNDWLATNPYADKLFEEICIYAAKYNMPVLIHTGEDVNVLPNRFEKFFAKYDTVKFVLAHCKEAKPIVELMKKYDNVYGDTAFCPSDSYDEILSAGFKDKMQYGTDFPISHWFQHIDEEKDVSEKSLIEHYRSLDTSF